MIADNKIKSILVLLILSLLIVVFLVPSAKNIGQEKTTNESLRLQEIASKRNLTSEDLITLKSLTDSDPELHEEFIEVEWMVTHRYHLHAQHTLESLFWIAKGEQWECPAETLSHIRPYLEANEIELANSAVNESEKVLPAWENKAKEAKVNNPNLYPRLDELLDTMKNVIVEVRTGEYTAAKIDAAYLEDQGYC